MSRKFRSREICFVCAFCLLAGLARAAEEAEKPVSIADLPEPVVAAIKKRFANAKLESAVKDSDDEQAFYEVSIKHKGHDLFVVCDPEGKIVEIDREITIKELPKPVRDALQKKHPKATFLSIEEVRDEADEVTYAVLLKRGKGTLHTRFDPKGKMLEEEPYEE